MDEPTKEPHAGTPRPGPSRTRPGGHARAHRSRSSVVIAAAGALGFAAFAVWLGTTPPPRVTHAEAMALALAIERATDLAQLEALVQFTVPTMPELPASLLIDGKSRLHPAAALLRSKQVAAPASYAFVGTREDSDGEPTLLFRADSLGFLVDYHELRLVRTGDRVKVADLCTMASVGWIGAFLREFAAFSAEERELFTSFDAAVAAQDAGRVEADFQRLPQRLRDSVWFGLRRLFALDRADAGSLRAGCAAFRTDHPESVAADILFLQHLGFDRQVNPDAVSAIDRIQARTGDYPFLDMMRKRYSR